MISTTTFRALKRFVESAPDLDRQHNDYLLLIALKMLEAKGRLIALGSSELTESNVFELMQKLHALNKELFPDDIEPCSAPEEKDYASALKSLRDPRLTEMFLHDAAPGYTYQFLASANRTDAQLNIQSANKELSKEQLIAFTQLYTPQWVVDFLLANTVLPQWHLEASTQELAQWRLETKVGTLETATVTLLDPACGAGNFLVRALALFISLYTTEGLSKADAVDRAVANNIFGADIDPEALWTCSLAMLVKCLEHCDRTPSSKFQLSLAFNKSGGQAELLGSLSRDFSDGNVLSRKYSVVATNPPYIGRKLMSRDLKSAIRIEYPNCHHDLCAAFIERSMELLDDGGRFGVITQASVLSLPSYSELRKFLLAQHSLISCIDAGSGVFPLQGGDKVNSALLVFQNNRMPADRKTSFFDLRQETNKPLALLEEIQMLQRGLPGRYVMHHQSTFLQEDDGAIKYNCPYIILALCRQAKSIGDVADIRQGLATSDNDRFVRPIDVVDSSSIGSTWMPYVKGAGSDRWFSPVRHVVKWEDNGREIKEAVAVAYPYLKGNIKWVVKNEQYYFRSGLCFSFVNTRNLAVRKLPQGCIFDVGASAVFANDPDEEDFLLAYLNSSLLGAIATAMNPTINFQVGDIKRLPMFEFDQQQKSELSEISVRCCAIARELNQARQNEKILVNAGAVDGHNQAAKLSGELTRLEKQNDAFVLGALIKNYALSLPDQTEIATWLSRQYSAKPL